LPAAPQWELGPRGERIPTAAWTGGPLRPLGEYTKPIAISQAELGNYEAAELAENYMCPSCHVLARVNPREFNLRGYSEGWQRDYVTAFVEIPLKANPIGGAWEIGVSGGQAITGESSGLHISNIVHGNFDVGRNLSTSERLWEGGTFIVGAATLGVGLRAPAAAAGTGAFSEGASGGAGLGRLATAELRVSQQGLQTVEQHLARFGSVPQNEAMIARLREALTQGRRISGADASFYMHEVNEATLMGRGLTYEVAHASALSKYQVSPFSVYHPEVIQAFPSQFNQNWLRFWGISE
jgi:hypothetical protein